MFQDGIPIDWTAIKRTSEENKISSNKTLAADTGCGKSSRASMWTPTALNQGHQRRVGADRVGEFGRAAVGFGRPENGGQEAGIVTPIWSGQVSSVTLLKNNGLSGEHDQIFGTLNFCPRVGFSMSYSRKKVKIK
jgi:hypothetical protein